MSKSLIEGIRNALLNNPEIITNAVEFIASDHPSVDMKKVAEDQLPSFIAGIAGIVLHNIINRK